MSGDNRGEEKNRNKVFLFHIHIKKNKSLEKKNLLTKDLGII